MMPASTVRAGHTIRIKDTDGKDVEFTVSAAGEEMRDGRTVISVGLGETGIGPLYFDPEHRVEVTGES